MYEAAPLTVKWLNQFRIRNQAAENGAKSPPLEFPVDALSRFVFYDGCDGSVVATVPIEPLVGILRHPYAVCGSSARERVTSSWLVDKDYLLAYFMDEWARTQAGGVVQDSRSFLFDMGCSTYNDGLGGASLSWFIDHYRARGVHFDRVLAWEATKLDPNKLLGSFPKDVLANLSYYNVPVDTNPGALHHPWSILKRVAKKEDFIVVKIDIDAPMTEDTLMMQLMDDPTLMEMIDEMYFEHHTTGNPMMFHGWGRDVGLDIVDSYEMFYYLRENGIRIHSWV